MIKLAVSGAQGRMGKTITECAFDQADIFEVTTLLEHKDHPEANGSINGLNVETDNASLKGCDALIEFTLPDGTIDNLKACVENNIKMVIGTTGFNDEQITMIHDASAQIPIVFASNMSVGVNVLFKLIEIASNTLGADKIDISETHHVHKKDVPSGTAKTMAEFAEPGYGNRVDSIESFREGEVIGDHTIVFNTPEDTLTISHHAKDRKMFAKGALRAAEFLQDKQNGLYNMQDVLGLTHVK